MIATLAALLALLAAASLIGQAVLVVSGRNAASPLAPALGLATIGFLAWGTVRLPGEGTAVLIAVGLAALAGLIVVRRATGIGDLLVAATPVAVVGALAASLPFVIEGRFGILGMGLNPDMSQHLYATYALVDGGVERLVSSGYPLGPHAAVAGLDAAGIGPVQGFAGLAIATAVAACVAPLAALSGLSFERRLIGCLVVGLPYMVASYLIQGAFKETLQALFILAFVLYMAELERGRERGLFVRARTGEDSALRSGIPLAVLAAGSVYVLSFPALAWLGGALGLWALARLVLGASGPAGALGAVRGWLPPTLIGLAVFAVLVAPELGRALDFARFETFDPDGEGLGNLFNPISPLEALGVWPSGDFRLDPGAGAVPAAVFWAGGALAAVATLFGLLQTLRRGELALPAAFAVAAALVAYAVLAGTPYQAAKAIALVAPLAMLLAVRELLGAAADLEQVARLLRWRRVGGLAPRRARRARADLAVTLLAAAFVAAAGVCSALALANGPVGPDRYDPALRDLAAGLGGGSTLVLAPEDEINRQHAGDFLTWEFRGNRVCVDSLQSAGGGEPAPPGITRVVTVRTESDAAPFAGLRGDGGEGDYAVWTARPAPAGPGPCPFVSDGARSNPASGAAG